MKIFRTHGVTVLLSAWLAIVFCAGEALTYAPCSTPPVVSSAAGRPNLLLMVDFSGTMALPAFLTTTVDPGVSGNYYSPGTSTWNNESFTLDAKGATSAPADYVSTTNEPYIHTLYNPRDTYYGIFKTDQYYEYDTTGHFFKLATTPPVTSVNVTGSSDGGTDSSTTDGTASTNYSITFTTQTGHGFSVGDLVVFSNMPSHAALNGNAYEVTAASGTTFTVRTMVTTQASTSLNAQVQSPPYPCKWNGISDAPKGTAPYGTVAKRTNTGMKFTTGISGNMLNFMTMSRSDVTMKVLIGGREQSPHTAGDYYYIKGLGSRYFADFTPSGVVPGTNPNDPKDLKAGFYVRPATLDGGSGTGLPANYPDNYATGLVLNKNSFLTVFGQYTGALDSGSLQFAGEVCEGWKFTAPFNATVKMTLNYNRGTPWIIGNGARIAVYADENWNTPVPGGDVQVTSGSRVSLSLNVTAGTTYYVRVTTKDVVSSNPPTWIPPPGTSYGYTLHSTADLEKDTTVKSYWSGNSAARNRNGEVATAIGAIPFADVRIAIPEATWAGVRHGSTQCGLAGTTLATCPRGIVQDTFGMVRWGFMFFNSWVTGTGQQAKQFKGKLVVGCENRDIQLLLRAMQGITKKADGSLWLGTTYPYNQAAFVTDWMWNFCYGTPPMGPALEKAQDYFQMANNSSGADNSLFTAYRCPTIGPGGTVIDPYYDQGCTAIPCRKSFIIMVSTGTDSTNPDPSIAIQGMHGLDIRDDMAGTQDVKLYSVYTYGTNCQGGNAMKTLAVFGGATDQGGACGSVSAGKPFTWNSTSNNSAGECWPRSTGTIAGQCPCSLTGIANCDPNSPLYDETCCKSWSTPAYWDRFSLGVNQFKGVPDNYYEASQGSLLADSLTKVLHDIVTVNASASAVATVSQEIKAEDIIVRGAFRATDPEILTRNLWFGHLEAFWPDTTNNNTYDFEYSCNKGLLCYEMPGPLAVGSTGAPCPSARSAYCWDAATFLNDPLAVGNRPRRIFTGWDTNVDGRIKSRYSGTTVVEQKDFDLLDWAAFQPFLKLTLAENDFYGTTGTIDQQDVQALMNWVRGTEDDNYRSRVDENGTIWRLGDIVYSTPVVQGVPSLGAVSPRECEGCATGEYYDYRNRIIARRDAEIGSDPSVNRTDPEPQDIHDCVKQMVYVGANDGMVHAIVLGVWDWGTQSWHFQKNTGNPYAKYVGEELWAYIPSNLLSELKYLASATNYGQGSCAHRYMVDLSENLWQVNIESDCTVPDANGNAQSYGSGGKCWRSVLLGGQRGGGDLYFAIDVTNPDDPRLLWEYSAIKDLLTCGAADGKFYRYPYFDTASYDALKILPLTWSKPQVGRVALPSGTTLYAGNPDINGFPTGAFAEANPRYVAFVGGGFRVFENSWQPLSTGPTYDLTPLQKPNLAAIDIETGQNLFRYVWPYLVARLAPSAAEWATVLGGSPSSLGSPGAPLPHAMSDSLLLDLWDAANDKIGDDGYVDHLYVGDLYGNFFGMKFYFDRTHGQTYSGLLVDVRKTMPGQTREPRCPTAGNKNPCSTLWSDYIGSFQPITTQPVATVNQQDTSLLHVIFGTGKFDDTSLSTYGGGNDFKDPVRMSIYNLQERIDLTGDLSSKTKTYGGQIIAGSNFYTYVNKLSTCSTFNSPFCRWRKADGSADCCQSSCTSTPPCWACVFDLTHPTDAEISANSLPSLPAGERVVNKGLIAGGLLFVTTYAPPSDVCSFTGNGYLYIFDYMCSNPSTVDFASLLPSSTPATTFTATTASGETATYGVQVNLGTGMPSQPVLDSAAENVILQLSDASLLKLPVDLPQKRIQGKAWRER